MYTVNDVSIHHNKMEGYTRWNILRLKLQKTLPLPLNKAIDCFGMVSHQVVGT